MIKITVTIEGPRACGKTFFLQNVEHVVDMIWRHVKFTSRERFGEQVPTEKLIIEIKEPINTDTELQRLMKT